MFPFHRLYTIGEYQIGLESQRFVVKADWYGQLRTVFDPQSGDDAWDEEKCVAFAREDTAPSRPRPNLSSAIR